MENKVLRKNLILPCEFLENWKTKNENGVLCFKYIDFASDEIKQVDLENTPFIEILFASSDSFDSQKITNQYNQIAKVAKAIIDKRIKKNELNLITGKEVLFLKYFYFLITFLNGEYKYNFSNDEKKYRIFDILDEEINQDYKFIILNIISYIIFEMYDYIFSQRTFESLYEYVENSNINFKLQEYQKVIYIPNDILISQNFKFLDVYFHNVVNNTFLKIFKIDKESENNFLLTNKSVANFIDEKTKINILSLFVVDPKIALGFVNLGPGRGEYRPLFKYLNNNLINKQVLPKCLIPEHEIQENGIYLSGEQRFTFQNFWLNEQQVKLINNCLTYRNLKFDFEQFVKSNTNQ